MLESLIDQSSRNLPDIDFLAHIIRFLYNFVITFTISYFVYFRNKGKTEFLFTYLLIGAIIFQLCIMLKVVPLELGIALGLFAIFGIIRYRTYPISPREMTYLFVIVGISAANGLLGEPTPYLKMIISDLLLLGVAVLGETFITKKITKTKLIVYEKIELLEEGRREELKEDLQKRLGLNHIKKIQLGKVDFLKDIARLKVTFDDKDDSNFEDI